MTNRRPRIVHTKLGVERQPAWGVRGQPGPLKLSFWGLEKVGCAGGSWRHERSGL